MTKQFTLLQLFSIVDGRLSTDIVDVYKILNHVTEENLFTHELPAACRYLESKNPTWFKELNERFAPFKKLVFNEAIKNIPNEFVDVPQLKDEVDVSDFYNYMVRNSLLPRV